METTPNAKIRSETLALKHISEQVEYLYNSSGNIGDIAPMEMVALIDEIIAEGQHSGSKREIKLLETRKAGFLSIAGNSPLAYDILTNCLTYFEQERYDKGIVFSLRYLAVVYEAWNEHTDALAHYLRAFYHCKERLAEPSLNAMLMNCIGAVYKNVGELQLAKRWCLGAYDIFTSEHHLLGISQALVNLGEIDRHEGNYDNAIELFQRAMSCKEQIGDYNGKARTMVNMSGALLETGRYTESLDCLNSAEKIFAEVENEIDMIDLLHWRGQTFAQLQRHDEAIYNFEFGHKLSETLGLKANQAECNAALALEYEKVGKFELALKCTNLAYRLQKELDQDLTRRAVSHALEKAERRRVQHEAQIIVEKNADLLQANAELQRLSAEKDDVLSMVAHDLKNPLGTIKMLADALHKLEGNDRELVLEYSADIRSMVDTMLALISDFLAAHRVANMQTGLQIQPENIGELLQTTCKLFEYSAMHKNIDLKLGEIHVNSIATDASILKQIFENLISNAVKYTPVGGTVCVDAGIVESLNSKGKVFRFSVSDTGPGISEEDSMKMFGKYQKLSAEPTGEESSTGLGLYIVKKLADALGADIMCTSIIGKGTTFILDLPILDISIPNYEEH